MAVTINLPRADPIAEQKRVTGGELRRQISELLSALYPAIGLTKRRCECRYPFPYCIRLTPVAEDGSNPRGETVVVEGKHLWGRGLRFCHPQPLPERRMIASLPSGRGVWLSSLIDLTWCRFIKPGHYESEGR
ncbi:MAG: hypothetical protein ACYSWU_04095, partial [Planctomycetota bacterium]